MIYEFVCPSCKYDVRYSECLDSYVCDDCGEMYDSSEIWEANRDKCTCNVMSCPCEYCNYHINNAADKKEETMRLNRKNFAELFRTDFYTIEVKFVQSINTAQVQKTYIYKVHKDMRVEIGERLLVCVSNEPDLAEELKVVVVFKINNEPEIDGAECFDKKWIVGRYADLIKDYKANIERDTQLKRSVSKLEAALERVSLRKQLEAAMEELDEETKQELTLAFGTPFKAQTKLEGAGNGS